MELEERLEAWTEESKLDEIIDHWKMTRSWVSLTSLRRNTVKITGLASTAIRYDASSRMAGAIATAYLGDLIRAVILTPEAASLCRWC